MTVNNTLDIVFSTVGSTIFLGLFVWIGVSLHMAYTKMELLLEHLKNCAAIRARAPLRYFGPWGKFLLIGGISGIVTFPGFYLKRGELSSDDLENLPVPLRGKLVAMHWTVILLTSALMLLWAIGKIVGWL